MAGQMERGMLETMLESTKMSGNVLTTDQTMNPNVLLDALEMLLIDFEDDDREKPVKPTMVLHPEVMKNLEELKRIMRTTL